jgi:hypothetical protein
MRCEHRDQADGRRCENTALENGQRCFKHADTFHKQEHQAARAVGNGRITRKRVVLSFHLYDGEETSGYLDRLRAAFTAREGLRIEVKEEVL